MFRFFLLRMFLFPLDNCSVITTNWDNHIVTSVIVKSCSWNMFRMTSHSSACLRVLCNWEIVNAYGTVIITCNNISSVSWCIYTINIWTISTLWENTSNFPTKFTCRSCPDWLINKCCSSIWDLLRIFNIIENFGVCLIDSSNISGVSWPINT